ncbi:MAG: PecA family PE domain-processing aspartic protease [Mycobacteriaceae bacterium]
MSHAARKRAAHGRIQPYAWLGAGALTLGMGAAMVGGTAVAFADTGSDSAGASQSAEKAANDSSASTSNKTDAPRRAGHSARGNTADGSASTGISTPGHRGRIPAVVDTPDVPDSTPVVENNKPLPAAAVATGRAGRQTAATVSSSAPAAPAADSSPATDVSAPAPAADPAPAAAVAPAAADPAPSTESWLPVTPIVPGVHVKAAVQEITLSQASLKQATWGSGNILAGLGSFGPNAALATAQALLGIWSSTIADAQSQVASTVGKPLLHGIAQARLQNELTYTKLAGISLQTASALITPLGWLGADVAPTQALVAQAQQDGKVYAKVPVQMVAGTEPVVKAKINGGSNVKLLVDSGASGLVTTADKVPAAGLGEKTGGGNSCFSGGLCYHYDTYNTTVDLGDGAVGTAPVNIVTDTAEYPDGVKNFKQFFSWGADGILGVGANTAGPGPVPIPTAAMPGELSDGVLIYQNANLFGNSGYMILGPNLFPTKVSLPGAPDAYVKVSVNGGAKQDGAAIIDSGGVYGTLNRSLYPGTPTGENVPAGTKIDVYSPDGATLLYSYTTQGASAPTTFIDTGLFNTGNAPYAQNPIYLNYGTTPYGIGSTDFSIY